MLTPEELHGFAQALARSQSEDRAYLTSSRYAVSLRLLVQMCKY
jgi:hypothetical protein